MTKPFEYGDKIVVTAVPEYEHDVKVGMRGVVASTQLPGQGLIHVRLHKDGEWFGDIRCMWWQAICHEADWTPEKTEAIDWNKHRAFMRGL